MIDIETMVEPPAAEPLKPIFTPVDKVAEFPHSDELPEGCQVFDINTALMVSEIDMLAMNGQFDDIAIDEGVVTFTDVQTGLTLSND